MFFNFSMAKEFHKTEIKMAKVGECICNMNCKENAEKSVRERLTGQ